MATVTMHHPAWRDYDVDVPEADVPAWAAAGWLTEDPTPALYRGRSNYDAARSLYNFKPAQVQRLRAALGRSFAGTGLANLAFLGDSTTGGAGTNAVPWSTPFERRLAAKGHASSGTGVVGAYKGSADDAQWSKGAGWNPLTSGSTLISNNSTANPATFTSTTAGTITRVHYSHRSTSPFTVAIDGGAPVTVTPNGSSTADVYEVAGLADTTHSISIVRTATDSKYVQIFGAEVTNGDTGLRIYNAGVGGAKVPTSLGWYTVDAFAAGPTAFNADAVFLMFETNDTPGPEATWPGTPVADYKANLQALITNIRGNGADVILITAVPSNGKEFAPYTAALYQLADENDLPLIDLQARMGSYARSAELGIMRDGLHPNVAGYNAVAEAIAEALSL